MCLWVLQHNLGGWHMQETITQTMNSDVELCLFSAFCAFQFRGWPLPVVRYFALWEPLSVCEQGPDEGPQGLPARWSHQAALLQVAERAPAGGGRARHSGQEGPISGGEWDHEKRWSRLKEGSITELTLFSFVFSQSIPSYDTIVQTSGRNSWHIPYDDTEDRSTYEVPQHWLCLNKKLWRLSFFTVWNIKKMLVLKTFNKTVGL